MAKRKGLSNKIRFEVFKRDSFQCQYCGKSAPDVVLNVDHINPVSKGGENDLLNLITSCFDCNSGKSDRLLDDDSVVAKQRAQLAELEERKNQLEMMLNWRDGLNEIEDLAVDAVCDAFYRGTYCQSSINETGISKIKQLLKKYELAEVLDATDKACSQYFVEGVEDSSGKAFRMIAGILRNSKRGDGHLYYIRGIVRNRMHCNERRCIELLQLCHSLDADPEYLKQLATTARNWTQWVDWMEDYESELKGDQDA